MDQWRPSTVILEEGGTPINGSTAETLFH